MRTSLLLFKHSLASAGVSGGGCGGCGLGDTVVSVAVADVAGESLVIDGRGVMG